MAAAAALLHKLWQDWPYTQAYMMQGLYRMQAKMTVLASRYRRIYRKLCGILRAVAQAILSILLGDLKQGVNTVWQSACAWPRQYSMRIDAPRRTIDCILCKMHNFTLYTYYDKLWNCVSWQRQHTQMLSRAKIQSAHSLCILPVYRYTNLVGWHNATWHNTHRRDTGWVGGGDRFNLNLVVGRLKTVRGIFLFGRIFDSILIQSFGFLKLIAENPQEKKSSGLDSNNQSVCFAIYIIYNADAICGCVYTIYIYYIYAESASSLFYGDFTYQSGTLALSCETKHGFFDTRWDAGPILAYLYMALWDDCFTWNTMIVAKILRFCGINGRYLG